MTIKVTSKKIVNCSVTTNSDNITINKSSPNHINIGADDYSRPPHEGKVFYDNDVEIDETKVKKETWQ